MKLTLRRRRGFTLPEVLATLVIIGIVLPVAMRGITMSVQAAGDARRKSEAAQLAQQKLNELIMDRSNNASFNGTGDFGEDFSAYTWESTSNTASLNTTAEVEEVNVTVKWTAQGAERHVTLSTLIFPGTAAMTGGQ